MRAVAQRSTEAGPRDVVSVGDRALRLSVAPSRDPIDVLRALTLALPVVAFLTDGREQVLWMTRHAEERLSAVAVPRRALEELTAYVRARGAGRPRWLERREELIVRSVDGFGATRLALVSVVPATARCRVPSLDDVRVALSLSAREAEVGLLAAQGFSTLNIASRLDVAESTVRTYLKRVYQKTGVCSRAELACRVLGVDDPPP